MDSGNTSTIRRARNGVFRERKQSAFRGNISDPISLMEELHPESAIDGGAVQISCGNSPFRRRSSWSSRKHRTCRSGGGRHGRSRRVSGSRPEPCRRHASSSPCSGIPVAWSPPRSSRGPWRRVTSGRGPRPRRCPTIF